MKRAHTPVTSILLLAAVAAMLLLAPATAFGQNQLPLPAPGAGQPPAQTAPSPPPAGDEPATAHFEKLLKDADFNYQRVEGKSAFIISIEDRKGQKSRIVAVVTKKQDLSDRDFYRIFLFTSILELPANFKIPPEMMSKLNEINDGLGMGKVTVSEGALYYSNTFWLETATPRVVEYEIVAAHCLKVDVYKTLAPFVFEQ